MKTTMNDGLPAALPPVAELQRLHEHYHAMYEYAPTGYFLLDESGTILEVNHAGCQQLGLLERLSGRRFPAFLAACSLTSFEVFLRRVFAGPEPQRVELKLAQSGDGPLYIQLDGIKCHKSQTSRIILTDITALKLAQEQISALNLALEQRVEDRTTQIRELNTELESFVQAVTHELQEPLRQATTLSDILHRPETLTPEKAEHFSQTMLERVNYMNILLDALNTYFRAGRQRARFIPVSLERVLADVKKDLKPKLQGCLVVWRQDALPTVTGDSRSLQTIFYALLDNALKFSQGRDPIQITVLKRETDTEYQIGVQDNGIGFSKRQKENIFGIFQRLNSEKDYEGLGLGLPLVRQAVRRHGGRCWAESQEGRGSIFWVALPKQPARYL